MQRNALAGIFVEADDPKFLEREVEPAREVLDLAKLDVASLLAEYRARQKNYDTAPFDPEGQQIRFFPAGFSIWSGFPGAGKTTLLRQFACHLMHRGRAVFIASLEEDPLDVFYRLACVALGTPEPTEDGLQWCVDAWADTLRLWSYRRGIADHARMLAVIRVLARQGVRHAFIDSLARLDVHSGDWEAQRLFGNALEATAANAGIHIHLVAHPRKLVSANQEPDINDVAGSADIGRLADNVLFVRRYDADTFTGGTLTGMEIMVRKQRYFEGGCPTIRGFFNRATKQFNQTDAELGVIEYLPPGAYGKPMYPGARA